MRRSEVPVPVEELVLGLYRQCCYFGFEGHIRARSCFLGLLIEWAWALLLIGEQAQNFAHSLVLDLKSLMRGLIVVRWRRVSR